MFFQDFVAKRGNKYYVGICDLDGNLIDETEIKEEEYLKLKEKYNKNRFDGKNIKQ